MSNVAAYNAMRMRISLHYGNNITTEGILLEIIPSDDDIKKEDILRRFYSTVGKRYECDGVDQIVTNALKNLLKEGKITRISHGIYRRLNN